MMAKVGVVNWNHAGHESSTRRAFLDFSSVEVEIKFV